MYFSFCEKKIIHFLPFCQLGFSENKQQKIHAAYLSIKGVDQKDVRGLGD